MSKLFSRKPSYPKISLSNLDGFSEDRMAAKRFEYRFLPITLGGFVIAGVGLGCGMWIGNHAQKLGDEVAAGYAALCGVVLFGIGFICSGLGIRRMLRSPPIDPVSGEPMEIYTLEDTTAADKLELIYLSRGRRTYFRRVFTE